VPTDVYIRNRVQTDASAYLSRQSLEIARETNNNLVEVSRHAGCRLSHSFWEGGIYQLQGSGKYPNFYQKTMYVYGPYADWIEGLCGYNCYHSFRIYNPSIGRMYDQDPLKGTGYTNEQVYALRGEQRRLENDIRHLKRQREVLKSQGLKTNGVTAKIRAKQAALGEHVEKHSSVLRRNKWREKVYFKESNFKKTKFYVEEAFVPERGVKNKWRINRAVVNTQAFHAKFEALSLPKKVQEKLYKATGVIFRELEGTQLEHLFVFSARNGNKIFSTEGEILYEKGVLRPPEVFLEKFRNTKGGVVTLHNHANSTRPSMADIISAAEDYCRKSVVVCFDGSIYEIEANVSLEKMKEVYNTIIDDLLVEYPYITDRRELVLLANKAFYEKNVTGQWATIIKR